MEHTFTQHPGLSTPKGEQQTCSYDSSVEEAMGELPTHIPVSHAGESTLLGKSLGLSYWSITISTTHRKNSVPQRQFRPIGIPPQTCRECFTGVQTHLIDTSGHACCLRWEVLPTLGVSVPWLGSWTASVEGAER